MYVVSVGEVSVGEAQTYILDSVGGTDFDTQSEAAAAAKQFLSAVDSIDVDGRAGPTVNVEELDSRLHHCLAGTRVWEWCRCVACPGRQLSVMNLCLLPHT